MLRNEKLPLRVGGELAAQVHVGLGRVLVLVEPFGRGLPDIDLGAGDRLAVRVLHVRGDEQLRSRRRRAHDRAAVLGARRIEPPERAEQVRRGLGLPVVAVVEQAHQRRDAERAGHQHRLVVERVGVLPDGVDVGRGLLEFDLGELHLADEGVQVPHQRRHDLAEARVGRVLDLAQHRLGDRIRSVDDHVHVSRRPFRRYIRRPN